MAKITTYNPRKITCAFGSHIVAGFADDSFISIEAAGDGTSYVVGADGEIAINIKDILGEEKFAGAEAWVSKPAPRARGKAQTNREWEIIVGEGEFK